MSSQIDVTKPTTGTATTQSVRDNFTQSVSDIEALQGEVSIRSVAASVASNALTLALKTSAGIDATSSTGVEISFRNSTAATGTRTVISATSALSVVAPQGATLGFANSATDHLYVYAINNSSTVEVAVSASLLDEGSLHSTTAISATADSATVLYSTTARTNVSVRILGRVKITTGSTAGTWSAAPTEIHSNGNFHLIIGQDVQSYAISAATKVTADAALPKAGGTMTGDTLHGDNVKAKFGASGDLEIYHDGSHSRIADRGTGDLRIYGDSLQLNSWTSGENYLTGETDGAVTLFNNGATKLATTATGIDVTGTVTADGLVVSTATGGSSPTPTTMTIKTETSASDWSTSDPWGRLAFYGVDGSSGGAKDHAVIDVVAEGATGGTSKLLIKTNDSVGLKDRINVAGNGDISFYEDTGTTPKFFWDASAEELVLTSAIAGAGGWNESLTLAASSYPALSLSATSSNKVARIGNNGDGSMQFMVNGSSNAVGTTAAVIDSSGKVGIGTISPAGKLDLGEVGSTGANFLIGVGANFNNYYTTNTAGSHTFRRGTTTDLKIDSSGNVLVGTATSYGGALTLIPSANPTTASATTSQLRIGESSANTAYSLNMNYMLNAGVYKGSLQAIAGGSPADLLLNADGGKVGIGTSSPTRKFHVKDDGLGSMKVESGGTSDTFLEMQTSSNRAYIGIDESLNLLKINNTGTLGSDTHLAIDSSGIVTKPNQPAFDVSMTAGGPVSGIMVHDVTYLDNGNDHNTTNGNFTAPVTGVYYFYTSYINSTAGASTGRRYFQKNGVRLYGNRHLRLDGAGGYAENGITGITLALAAGDYVRVEQGAGSSYGTTEYEVFGGYLIG